LGFTRRNEWADGSPEMRWQSPSNPDPAEKYFNPDKKSYLQKGEKMLATVLIVFLIILLVMLWREG
jgi:cell division protein FtsL